MTLRQPTATAQWTETAALSQTASFGPVIATANPDVFEIATRGTKAATLVLMSRPGFFGSAYFSSPYFGSPLFGVDPEDSDDQLFELRAHDLTEDAQLFFLGGVGRVYGE